MLNWPRLVAATFACALAACSPAEQGNANAAEATPDGQGLLKRGKYLASVMDCAGCHNVGAFSPEPDKGYLEGGTFGFEVPGLGVFYPPNLTPHAENGIGRWSEADIIKAVRQGQRPDGRMLAPAMPWRAYAALSDQDARALAAYLKSLPPSPRRVPAPTTPEQAPAPYFTAKMPAAE
jgi:mono/diheme cytochrome c family protein